MLKRLRFLEEVGMRGLGAFEMAQMKHRDARIFAMCQHLRSAIDIWEQIASEPFQAPEKAAPEPVPVVQPPPPPVLPPEKLTYSLKEAASAIGVGKSTLYKALSDGRLTAVKLGNRTLIPAEALRAWMSTWPRRG
jgi:excisionase family DNA binding protein